MAEEKKTELTEKEIKYMQNEISCYFLRRKQMKNYIQKIQAVLNGMPIEEVEKKYPPVKVDDKKE